VIVTAVELNTELVVTVKLAFVLPLGTVTVPGTLATVGELLKRETAAPPLGAGPFNTTVPWEVVPPSTLDGFN
jgi:pilus assembly protein TadC